MKSLAKRLISTAMFLNASAAFATNGMLFEGYGPISTGMGGASMAYDNGTSAMMNNPATLGLMKDGTRMDFALGRMSPSIESSYSGMNADSSATSFYMPAFGYLRKDGAYAYGVGVFAQGGMGVEYAADSFMAAGSGEAVRSEAGVMRVIAPIAYRMNSKLVVGGSLDFVRTTMDLKMAAMASQLSPMIKGCSGAGCAALPGLGATDWARFDFSDSSSYSGAASNYGFAAKLGAVYDLMPNLRVGASYHSKTFVGDLKTGSDAKLSAKGLGSDTGTITVKDFQMPSVIALGAAWSPMDKLMVVADYKRIGWASVLDAFRLNFAGSTFTSLDVEMTQKWEDQDVFALGASYQAMENLNVRGGLSLANNPVPNAYVNPLFPGTTTNHYTVGAGYTINPATSFEASLSLAPEVSVVNGSGVAIKHSQTNLQLMYVYNY